MKNYIMSVLCAALFSGVLSVTAPEKKGLSKYVSFACALSVALVLLFPLTGDISLNGSFDDFTTNDKTGEGARYTASAAADMLCTLYGIEKEDVTAKAEISPEGETEKIELCTAGKNLPDKEKTGEYLTELFKVKIVIHDAE